MMNEGTMAPSGVAGTPILAVDKDGYFRWLEIVDEPDATTPDETATGAGGQATTITYTADNDAAHVISGLAWSYSAAPTGGNISIADGADTVFDMPVTAAGPGWITFNPPKRGHAGNAMVITLAAPGGAVVGKVNVIGHWVKPSFGGAGGSLVFNNNVNSGNIAAIF